VSNVHILLAAGILKLAVHTCYQRWYFYGLLSVK